MNAASNAAIETTGLYLHFPFCAVRCTYCDFATVAGRDGLIDDYLDALTREIRERFEVTPDAEITLEGNPESLTDERLRGYRQAGVTRLSVGVQSLDDGVLEWDGSHVRLTPSGRLRSNELFAELV